MMSSGTTTAADLRVAAGHEETGWLSAHLFHQGDLDALLTTLVRPLVTEIGAPAFFLRYWEGGNHVRVRVHIPDPADREAARTLIRFRAGEHFARHPSPDLMDADYYRRVAADLARGEDLGDYATEMQPNNSVRFLPYRREHLRYGTGRAMAATERHFVESSAIALDLLARPVTPEQRDTVAYALALLAWFAAEPDPQRLLAHREPLHRRWAASFGPLGLVADDEADRRWEGRRARLTALAERLRGGDAPGDPLGRWSDSVTRLAAALAEPGSGAPPCGALGVLDSCVHLFCNRVGVAPPGEVYLRHLALNAVAELAR